MLNEKQQWKQSQGYKEGETIEFGWNQSNKSREGGKKAKVPLTQTLNCQQNFLLYFFLLSLSISLLCSFANDTAQCLCFVNLGPSPAASSGLSNSLTYLSNYCRRRIGLWGCIPPLPPNPSSWICHLQGPINWSSHQLSLLTHSLLAPPHCGVPGPTKWN